MVKKAKNNVESEKRMWDSHEDGERKNLATEREIGGRRCWGDTVRVGERIEGR